MVASVVTAVDDVVLALEPAQRTTLSARRPRHLLGRQRGLLCTLAATMLAACGASSGESAALQSSLDDLREQHEAEIVRLDGVRQDVRVAEATLRAHDARIAWTGCLAVEKDIEALVAASEAECMLRVAEHSGCVAENAEGTMDNEVIGGLLGLAAAVATGGVAAPFILGGAVAGRAVSDSAAAACGPVPVCAGNSDADRLRAALQVRGLDDLPECDDLQHPACVAEHFLFLGGKAETVAVECLGDREAECEAQAQLVELGVLDSSDCDPLLADPPAGASAR